jgi:hypothetical protein
MNSPPAVVSSLPDAHRRERDWVRFAKPRRPFSPPLLCRLPKPNARSATVLVDELDARFFEGPLNNFNGRAPRLTRSVLQLVDSNSADASLLRQILLTPT